MSRAGNWIFGVVVILGCIISGITPPVSAQKSKNQRGSAKFPFFIYNGYKAPDNHYAPSGWMGDYGDLRFNDNWQGKGVCTHPVIQIRYSAKKSQNLGWAGIYWQDPPNNWGSVRSGYNLSGARRLVFLARGDKGGEVITQVKVGGITGYYRDTATVAIRPITLSRQWQPYAVYLQKADLHRISGGLCLTLKRNSNPHGATIYLDKIRYE